MDTLPLISLSITRYPAVRRKSDPNFEKQICVCRGMRSAMVGHSNKRCAWKGLAKATGRFYQVLT
jgi:hypothetical protein